MRHANNGLRKLCEHPRRRWATCDHPWHFSFKWKDTHYRFSLDKHLDKHVDSKSDAEDEAAKIRMAIKAGAFGQPAAREDMTLRQLADTYLERYVDVDHAATANGFRYALGTICRTVIQRPTGGSTALGDEWIKTAQSAVLAVPSVLVPQEWSFLLNPKHPDFAKLKITDAGVFNLDPRLRRRN